MEEREYGEDDERLKGWEGIELLENTLRQLECRPLGERIIRGGVPEWLERFRIWETQNGMVMIHIITTIDTGEFVGWEVFRPISLVLDVPETIKKVKEFALSPKEKLT